MRKCQIKKLCIGLDTARSTLANSMWHSKDVLVLSTALAKASRSAFTDLRWGPYTG